MKYKSKEDREKVEKADYSKEVIFDWDDFDSPGHLLQTVTIPANTEQRLHHHKKQTEVYYILSGQAEIEFNGEKTTARPGDAFITEPGDKHKVINNTNEDFKLAVFKINYPKDSDTVWEENN